MYIKQGKTLRRGPYQQCYRNNIYNKCLKGISSKKLHKTCIMTL